MDALASGNLIDAAASGSSPVPREQWQHLADAHRRRIRAAIGPYLDRRRAGGTHPVIDFLFTYYSVRPGSLLRWHPGYGVALQHAHHYRGLRGYAVDDDGTASVEPAHLDARRSLIRSTTAMARATASRPPRFGCFGLHEWAMVYRTDQPRHRLPLRLGAAGTDAVVREHPIRCTHFDAFRFFTAPARPLNSTTLTRSAAIDNEQPGCLHATMDLYRYCLALTPLIPSALTVQAFEVALTARELDMRAGPYDLTAYGYDPVPIETAEGRVRYVREQAAIAARGSELRESLVTACTALSAEAGIDVDLR